MADHLQSGIDFFNSGRFFEAHESWEDLWRETAGDARLFYQGLVQVAVGLHHLSSGNARGGRRVLQRGLDKLRSYPAAFAGIDNSRFIKEILVALDSGGPPAPRIHRLSPPDEPRKAL